LQILQLCWSLFFCLHFFFGGCWSLVCCNLFIYFCSLYFAILLDLLCGAIIIIIIIFLNLNFNFFWGCYQKKQNCCSLFKMQFFLSCYNKTRHQRGFFPLLSYFLIFFTNVTSSCNPQFK
jgi:hypothetical protein